MANAGLPAERMEHRRNQAKAMRTEDSRRRMKLPAVNEAREQLAFKLLVRRTRSCSRWDRYRYRTMGRQKEAFSAAVQTVPQPGGPGAELQCVWYTQGPGAATSSYQAATTAEQ